MSCSLSLFPLIVEDETLRMFVTLIGETNKAELDRRAEEIARQALSGPEDVAGEEGVAFGFYGVEPSSVVSRVKWEAGPGMTRTEWSVRNAAAGKARMVGRVGTTEVVSNRRIP